jgi:hypothetical protein
MKRWARLVMLVLAALVVRAGALPQAANPVPTLVYLFPQSALPGTTATLYAHGVNFVNGSVIQWNGTALATTFDSSTQLETTPLPPLTADGTAQVTVFSPAPGGGTSNALTFVIGPPPVTPGSFLVEVADINSNPLPGAVVRFGHDGPSQFTDANGQAQATLNSGTYELAVFYPGLPTGVADVTMNPYSANTAAFVLPPTGTGTTTYVTVPATSSAFDTGIDLQAGQFLILTATGWWSYSPYWITVTPDGRQGCQGDGTWTLANGGNCGALAARIGNGPWFYAGPSFAGPVAASGRLYLAINDAPGSFSANSGQLSVEINVSPGTANSCVAQPSLSINLNPGFYIATIRTAAGTREGYWGMQVITAQGLLSGGLNLGGAVQEQGGPPGFGAFYIQGTQKVSVLVNAEPLPGTDPSQYSMAVSLLDSNRKPVLPDQTGTTSAQFQTTLTDGFYIITVRTAASSPRATFQLTINSDSVTGGVNVGGFLAPGVVGYGAFYVPASQTVQLVAEGLPTFTSLGAPCLRISLLDANRNVIKNAP